VLFGVLPQQFAFNIARSDFLIFQDKRLMGLKNFLLQRLQIGIDGPILIRIT
jgi:hypothetical protein